jgi:murein DD-endopeptidase MepM/ murein hydrolase activator NlpD
MRPRITRRAVLQATGVLATAGQFHPALAAPAAPAYSYPMGFPGLPLGDGLLVRHGYVVENLPHYPGWWHTGENWHAVAGETAGLGVSAVAAGEVVFAGADYPGRVVIVAHPDGLCAMYGHLDDALAVEAGQWVERGQILGTVMARSDEPARSHLHFELRTFVTLPGVNGDTPQHGVSCGYQCPPGPGYWPMTAAEHPSALGWRNPTHVIHRRAWPAGVPVGTEALVSRAAPGSTLVWTAPADIAGAEPLADLALTPGGRFPLLEIDAGAEDANGTSAEAYRLWYRIGLAAGEAGWVQAAVPLADYSGADGRPAAVRFDFLPLVMTAGARS